MSGIHVQDDLDFNIRFIEHINEKEPDPQWRIDQIVYHNTFVIAFCSSGEAVYRYLNREVPVKEGDLLFFPKGLVRSARSNPDNPWSFYTVSFDIEFLNDSTYDFFKQFKNVIRSPHPFKLQSLFAELSMVWSGRRSGFTIKCKSIMMDILYQIIKEQDRAEHGGAHYYAIEKTANLILSSYKDHFSIDELAALSGLSSSHFRLLFKKIIGMTAVQYQNQIRIYKAKDLLLSGDCNVSEAARSVGFEDIYYFSRLFKKLTGASPSYYLKD